MAVVGSGRRPMRRQYLIPSRRSGSPPPLRGGGPPGPRWGGNTKHEINKTWNHEYKDTSQQGTRSKHRWWLHDEGVTGWQGEDRDSHVFTLKWIRFCEAVIILTVINHQLLVYWMLSYIRTDYLLLGWCNWECSLKEDQRHGSACWSEIELQR